ncbi:TRAP transporter small permease subunit [Shimia aestuarii]|uniref:TRAP transporter small permease protein n=1 Tax=Shimia aestuarii TaxID=254406 RepID=A0A1I4Q895_9RHOB|nr:TRAP transporter small permease [Shimia aestuarii]SFM36267.1 TRAP-type mannitol/chloroaromatic compound transport system, small permease component [Shimia aestuarii]
MTQNKVEAEEASIGPHWFRLLQWTVDGTTAALNVTGTVLIVGIMLLVNLDVFGRNFLDAPISGVPEMVSMSIVAIVFLQIAQAFRKGRLTRTEALLGFLDKRASKLRHGVDFLFAIASVALVWQLYAASWPLFVKSWKRGTFEGTVGDFTAPVWPVKLIILIGCIALIIQLIMFAATALFRLFGYQETDA